MQQNNAKQPYFHNWNLGTLAEAFKRAQKRPIGGRSSLSWKPLRLLGRHPGRWWFRIEECRGEDGEIDHHLKLKGMVTHSISAGFWLIARHA